MKHADFLRCVKQSPFAGSELPFSVEEMDRRIALIREEMAERKLDALLLCDPGNVYYTTGYYTFETSVHAAALLPLEGPLALQVHAIEISNPVLKGQVREIYSYSPHDGPDAVSRQLVDIIESQGLSRGRIGIEAHLPALRIATLRQLEASLPEAHYVDATDLVFRLRCVKSPQELDYHRRAADITSAGMRASLDAIRSGATENEIAAVASKTMIEAGSEFFTIQPVVVAGHRTAFNHTHHYRNRFKSGDAILLELGGCYARYSSPLIRNAVIGKPSDQMLRLDSAIRNCVAAVIATARAGVTGHDVAVAASKEVEALQVDAYHYGTYAYAVGAQFPPSWVERSVFIAEGQHQPLQAGMVFHMPICFRIPGQFGIGRSETIAITETGCEVLTSVPRDLHVVAA